MKYFLSAMLFTSIASAATLEVNMINFDIGLPEFNGDKGVFLRDAKLKFENGDWVGYFDTNFGKCTDEYKSSPYIAPTAFAVKGNEFILYSYSINDTCNGEIFTVIPEEWGRSMTGVTPKSQVSFPSPLSYSEMKKLTGQCLSGNLDTSIPREYKLTCSPDAYKLKFEFQIAEASSEKFYVSYKKTLNTTFLGADGGILYPRLGKGGNLKVETLSIIKIKGLECIDFKEPIAPCQFFSYRPWREKLDKFNRCVESKTYIKEEANQYAHLVDQYADRLNQCQ